MAKICLSLVLSVVPDDQTTTTHRPTLDTDPHRRFQGRGQKPSKGHFRKNARSFHTASGEGLWESGPGSGPYERPLYRIQRILVRVSLWRDFMVQLGIESVFLGHPPSARKYSSNVSYKMLFKFLDKKKALWDLRQKGKGLLSPLLKLLTVDTSIPAVTQSDEERTRLHVQALLCCAPGSQWCYSMQLDTCCYLSHWVLKVAVLLHACDWTILHP